VKNRISKPSQKAEGDIVELVEVSPVLGAGNEIGAFTQGFIGDVFDTDLKDLPAHVAIFDGVDARITTSANAHDPRTSKICESMMLSMRNNANGVMVIGDDVPPSAMEPGASTDWGAGKATRPGLLQGIRVLVVDDDAEIAEEAAEALEYAGATTFWLSDPLRAKEILADATEYWSVLVTDLEMPGCSGVELAAFSKALVRPTPAILVTGTNKVQHINCSKMFATVLQKPVCIERLILAVHEVSTEAIS